MLLAMMAASFMQHVSALCARTLETLLADWEISFQKSSMREVHGGADRSSRRGLPRTCKETRAWTCSRTDRARSDASASMYLHRAVHARPARARSWKKTDDNCIFPAQNVLVTAIPTSTIQSSCLSALSSVDSAAMRAPLNGREDLPLSSVHAAKWQHQCASRPPHHD